MLRRSGLHGTGRSPRKDQYARGTIARNYEKASTSIILTARLLESLAYQTNDVLQAMQADSGIHLGALQGGRQRQRQQSADADPV